MSAGTTKGIVSWPFAYPAAVVGNRSGTFSALGTIPAATKQGYAVVSAPTNEAPIEGTIAEHIAFELGDLAAFAAAQVVYVRDGGTIRWRLTLTLASGSWNEPEWQEARPELGILSATQGWEVLTSTVAQYTSTGGLASVWWGGGRPVSRDEPDDQHSVEVSSSPYVADATTHQYQGFRRIYTHRWLMVDAPYIDDRRREDPLFAGQAAYPAATDVGGLLTRWLEAAARGAELLVTIDRRERLRMRLVDSSPRLRDFASASAASGQKYDVTMNLLDLDSGSE